MSIEAISTERALKLALEALEADEQDMVADKDGHMVFRVDAAITALRQAIEQAEQVEPVAWFRYESVYEYRNQLARCTPKCIGAFPVYTAPPPRQPWVGLNADECNSLLFRSEDIADAIAKTSAKLREKNGNPPPRQPLTDEQIEAMWQQYCKRWKTGEKIVINFVDFARAIEAAHGIKEKNT